MKSDRVQETQREMFRLGACVLMLFHSFHILKSFRLGVCVLVLFHGLHLFKSFRLRVCILVPFRGLHLFYSRLFAQVLRSLVQPLVSLGGPLLTNSSTSFVTYGSTVNCWEMFTMSSGK